MNDTPQTDCASWREGAGAASECVTAEFARGLERENDTLRRALISSLRDTARLDWLQERDIEEGRTMAMPRYRWTIKQWSGNPGPDIRWAIDERIKDCA